MNLAENRAAVLKEVKNIIDEARHFGDAIQPERLAKIVCGNYPASGFSEGEVAMAIRQAAVAAGIELSRK